MFKRSIYNTLLARLQEPRRFLQVLAGPRQTGKTTLARQVTEALPMPAHYASADEPTLRDRAWMEQQWNLGRLKTREGEKGLGAALVLDEIQKIPDWSAVVKRLWDEDSAADTPLQVVLLGSSPLLLPKLQVLNTALVTAQSARTPESARRDLDFYGRLVESAVGAHLLNTAAGAPIQVFYWRERNQEVDFVLRSGETLVALEVKGGRRRERLPGLEAFSRAFGPHRKWLVGGQGIPLEEFLLTPASGWVAGEDITNFRPHARSS